RLGGSRYGARRFAVEHRGVAGHRPRRVRDVAARVLRKRQQQAVGDRMARRQHRERPVTPPREPRKKPYRTPRLVEYGDLRTITRGKGGNMNDDPTPPATRK